MTAFAQGWSQMQKLTGKVLMNKKDFHAGLIS